MNDEYKKVFAKKSNVLFVFAHPDDAEIYCGGTIARLVEDGKSVRLIKMTTGNKGSRGEKTDEKTLSQTRETEDQEALKVLGLKPTDSINLNLGDGEVENSLSTIGLIVKEIRSFQPDIIVTHNPEQVMIRDLEGFYYVNHRDHRNTAITTIDAAYPYSRDTLFFPEHLEAGLKRREVTEFLFVDSWGHQDSIGIEITKQAEKRIKAIASHTSQYSQKDAQSSTDYFAPLVKGRRFEQFRYVVAD
ncbi:MAG: PIG-L deacetylase family protein [Candidatus Dojkabacteria bacterium]